MTPIPNIHENVTFKGSVLLVGDNLGTPQDPPMDSESSLGCSQHPAPQLGLVAGQLRDGLVEVGVKGLPVSLHAEYPELGQHRLHFIRDSPAPAGHRMLRWQAIHHQSHIIGHLNHLPGKLAGPELLGRECLFL
jgi:hypothetical protein